MDQKNLLITKFKSLCKKDLSEHGDLLESATIIHQIFLSDPPLFDSINRGYDYKILFNFEEYNGDIVINGTILKQIATIARIGNHNSLNVKKYTRDQFFKCTALRFGDRNIPVSELINFYRNTKGGVHNKPDQKNKEKGHLMMKDLSELIEVNGNKIEGYDSFMKQIIESASEGLKPFIEKIQK